MHARMYSTIQADSAFDRSQDGKSVLAEGSALRPGSNRMSGVTLAMHHWLIYPIHLRAEWPKEGR